jgi:hypothetical protein
MPITKRECRAAAETAALYPPGFGNEYFAIAGADAEEWLRNHNLVERVDPFGEPRIVRDWLNGHPEDMGKG